MRELKVGDIVIYTDRKMSDYWKKRYGVPLYGKFAKIMYINNYDDTYLIEFKVPIGNSYDVGKKGKIDHCIFCSKDKFKLNIDHLKFKKWIKG